MTAFWIIIAIFAVMAAGMALLFWIAPEMPSDERRLQGVEMNIAYSKSAASTHAFALIAEGWNELVQDGVTPDGLALCPVKADDEVIYMLSLGGDVVGVLVYGLDTIGNGCAVKLAYVEPSMRKRGVLKAMLGALKAEAEKYGFRVVIETPSNSTIQAVMRHLNMPVASVVYDVTGAARGG